MEQHPSRTALPEHRWPAVAGIVAVIVLYAFLPDALVPFQRYIVIGVGIAVLIPLVALNPHRLTRSTSWSRALAIVSSTLLVLANQVTLVFLVVALISGRHDAPVVLLAALQVWFTNVIAFALLYWDLDRGGPVARTMLSRDDLPPADFRFPQDEDSDAVAEVAARSSATQDWTPRFADYLYTSLSNSMAYSATDAMPLSIRFKLLNGLQAFGCFVVLALVIARAVNILA